MKEFLHSRIFPGTRLISHRRRGLFVVLGLVMLLLPGCPEESVNVLPEDSRAEADLFGDVGFIYDVKEPAPDIFSGDVMGFAVMSAPGNQVWTSMTGLETGGGEYSLFAGSFTGYLTEFNSATGEWSYAAPDDLSSQISAIQAFDGGLLVICGPGGMLKRRYPLGSSGNPQWINDDAALRLTTDLADISGTGKSDVWVVGAQGTLVHWDGIAWFVIPLETLGLSPENPPDLTGVMAMAQDDVIVTGDGILLHYNGETWSKVTVAGLDISTMELKAVLGRGDQVWVGTAGDTLLSRMGGEWTGHAAPSMPPIYEAYDQMWLAPNGQLYTTGPHNEQKSRLWFSQGDGWGYLEVASPEVDGEIPEDYRVQYNSQLTGIWGITSERFFVSTQQGQILSYALHH